MRMIFLGGDAEGQKGTFSNQRKKEEEKRDKKKRKIFGSLSLSLSLCRIGGRFPRPRSSDPRLVRAGSLSE